MQVTQTFPNLTVPVAAVRWNWFQSNHSPKSTARGTTRTSSKTKHNHSNNYCVQEQYDTKKETKDLTKKGPTQTTKKKNKQKKEEGVPTIELSNKEKEGTTAEKKENVKSRKDLHQKARNT